MEWQDRAIILTLRPHGENAAIVTLLTEHHGRQSGLVRSARSPKQRGILLPGNTVHAQWRARLADQLGQLRCELHTAHAAAALTDPARLCALSAACALAELTIPEHQPLPALFGATEALLNALADPTWPSVYVHWELALLRGLGYGLDLSSCAATGSNDHLAYVSPKSGRAVSLSAGEEYADKLLSLPAFLVAGGEGTPPEIADGLTLTAYFLNRHVLAPHGQVLPNARGRLVERLGGSAS